MDKRTFLKTGSLLGLGSLTGMKSIEELVNSVAHIPAEKLAGDEDFWKEIRKGYKLKPDYTNLENGYYCIQPQEILDAYMKHVNDVNLQGAYYMRTVQVDNKKRVAAKLAEVAGCAPEELVITRNTTESLDLIISGMDWKPEDEALMADQDYGAMLDMFAQVSKRFGMKNKIVQIPMHPKSDEEIVKIYENSITPNTKLLMVCHMINITGHVLPIRKICDMAHSKGVPVMVDGAHAFAHLDFKLSDLDCDYYGCSLHKWLSVPLGAGFLYVKNGNASKVWPLFAEGPKDQNDIMRLNHTGTIPVHTDLAIENAIDFYKKIGAKRKEERLRYLQNYWTKQVRTLKNVNVNTPEDQKRCCGIANVGIQGVKPADMAKKLLDKYKIYTVAIDGKGVQGCRITPNVYTTTEELDSFVKAIKEMAAS
jgi:selenocysteine lyase/cysteine desulfurase